MAKDYVGWDNGTSGTIGIIKDTESIFIKTPIKKELSYTKKVQNITRLRFHDIVEFFQSNINLENCLVILERPMVNSGRFKATQSAMRTLEAQILILESLNVPYVYIDSKEWQSELLPKGIKGSDELKKASSDIGCRLFPQHKEIIRKHKDADGILIAEYARRKRL